MVTHSDKKVSVVNGRNLCEDGCNQYNKRKEGGCMIKRGVQVMSPKKRTPIQSCGSLLSSKKHMKDIDVKVNEQTLIGLKHLFLYLA